MGMRGKNMVPIRIRKLVSGYFNSGWIPFAFAIGTFVFLVILSTTISFRWDMFLREIFLIWVAISFLGTLSAGIYNFAKKRIAKGILNTVFSILILPLIAALFLLIILFFDAMFGESEDNFGKDIVIPEDMVMEEPINSYTYDNNTIKYSEVKKAKTAPAQEIDAEGKMLIDMLLDKNNKGSVNINTELPVLAKFTDKNRQKLIQHLKTTSHWRIVQDDKIYAIRRFTTDKGFFDSLNGYYGSFDLVDRFEHWDEDIYFQFRIILSLDGEVMSKPWNKMYSKYEVCTGIRKLKTKRSVNHGIESYLVLSSNGVTLEIMEDTKQQGRVFTQAACKLISNELQDVLDSGAMTIADFEQNMINAGRAGRVESDIWIENGMQGGMYNVFAHVNAKEAGFAYLKVYEATKNTPLSSHSIKAKSKKVMDFSEDNNNLKFLYERSITIYEGDWGVYYPARFELWFVPDSEQDERKLIEQIFKVEGWMR